MKRLSLVNPAIILTIMGFSASLVAIYLLIVLQPNHAILMIMLAFAFDLADGYVARKWSYESTIGRNLDSFSDVFLYLIFSSVLYSSSLSPNILFSSLITTVIMVFGVLRLIRFTREGFITVNHKKYYRGLTVVHILFIAISCYFLSKIPFWPKEAFSALVLLSASPLMLSDYKTYKIENYRIFAAIILTVVFLSLYSEYGYHK